MKLGIYEEKSKNLSAFVSSPDVPSNQNNDCHLIV